ncbi:uncharacterized protein LOC131668243 isoform X2 [Phymastichus coffea]|uniref:uncharacterized protein LOC131668243 isoform X2 n=1 Tax=Phymastichus coffea TaxID=108790 RepID=UPI00273BBFBF|nr:uncharacterized protein LOC131668243 isoform X2 [Phymastichus coffea]
MKRTKSESPEPHEIQMFYPDIKRPKIIQEEKENKYRGLLDLSDDVVLHIFKFVSAVDLMSLYLCCTRFNRLCCDRTLWKSLDLSDTHLSASDLDKYETFMQPATKLLFIRGNIGASELSELHLNFLNIVASKCPKLEDLIIEDYYINRHQIQIQHFPRTLKKLSLEGCHIQNFSNDKSYLNNIHLHIPSLTCLVLSNCLWVTNHSLMAISKIPNLKEVRMNSCHGLGEDIAYASIATKVGLKKLQILDVRDTFIGDSVVSSFSHISTLTEMYLECPSEETTLHVPEAQHQNRHVLLVQLPRPQAINQENIVQENNVELNHANDDRCHVTDRSICSLSYHGSENNQEVVQHLEQVQLLHGRVRSSTNPYLKKLVIRNYQGVTDQTLQHFCNHGPSLLYLDVTGTSVTKEGLQNFKIQRPEVILISSFSEI